MYNTYRTHTEHIQEHIWWPNATSSCKGIHLHPSVDNKSGALAGSGVGGGVGALAGGGVGTRVGVGAGACVGCNSIDLLIDISHVGQCCFITWLSLLGSTIHKCFLSKIVGHL